jgi:VIT1/CCC1 family predicted Fe2+/Mn2+ transporter
MATIARQTMLTWRPPRCIRPDVGRLHASVAVLAVGNSVPGVLLHQGKRAEHPAATSAATFAVGAAFPLRVAVLAPVQGLVWTVSIACLIGLAALGAIGAQVGSSNIAKATLRVASWGAVAMAATASIGALVGRAV